MSVIEEVKQRVDIVDFISRYTTLERAGSRYKGLCPFHDERTPSFFVSPDHDSWRCFGACGTGGDIYEFVMRKENLSFRDALELLAQETGVDLRSQDDDPSRQLRTKIFEINAAAEAYFCDTLQHHAAAADARAYLERRKIDQETRERFGIGFALDSWDGLRNHLTRLGHSLQDLLSAGVIKENAEGSSTYDAFRGRVVIPIRDRKGRTIGFGGRVLDDSVPKYLNTAETPVFHKSRVIFGLDLAEKALREADKVVIVEGYMDVIAAHQHGFTNVVACMGTAITSDQLQQLQRYTDNFVLALDADAAGQQATIRGLNQAREALKRVQKPRLSARGVTFEQRLAANLQIASMPEGSDPDDVIRQDPQRWQRLIDDARPLLDFYFQIVADQFDITSAAGKAAAVSALAPLIAELGDDVERSHYVQDLSKLVQIDLQTIDNQVRAAAKSDQARRRRATAPAQSEAGPPPFGPTSHLDEALSRSLDDRVAMGVAPRFSTEDHLLALLLHAPELFVWLAGACDRLQVDLLNTADFERAENREIYRTLKQFVVGDETWDSESFQDELPAAIHGHYGNIMAYTITMPASNGNELREDTAKALVNLRLRRLRGKNNEIQQLQTEAQQNNDQQAMLEYCSISNQIVREFSHLQRLKKQLNEVLFNRGRRTQGVLMR
jgi:DNA primase